MSESVLDSTLNFQSGSVDGYLSSLPDRVGLSNFKYSLDYDNDIFSALRTTERQRIPANSDALNSVLAFSRRSNSGSENASSISELKSCYDIDGSIKDQWLLSVGPLSQVNGYGGDSSYCALSQNLFVSRLSLPVSASNSSILHPTAAMPDPKFDFEQCRPWPNANDAIDKSSVAALTSQLSDQLNIGSPLALQDQGRQSDHQRMASAISPTIGSSDIKLTMTERIQVPSSDHVAEIVGKNGQRIRHLREQLKVWVKTPARDELPVFEITGMPEKLGEAKRIILQMSEHFSKVQQERQNRIEPNRAEERLYVEQDKVGLIVGASGQTIRWVQQLSDTHIATPRKQESVPGMPSPQTHFTICGTRERVRFAKQLICEYVRLRCQGLWLDPELEASPEATHLVQEFHARRLAEDTQRRGSAPASVTIATALSHLSSAGDAATAAACPQSLAELKRLWQEGGPPPAVWDGVLFGGLPPTSVPPPLQQPPPPSTLQALSDRRYSMDAQSAGQHHRQQQQQQFQQPQQPDQQHQRQFLFGLDLDGLDPLSKAKSHSDDLVLQAGSGVNGWM